MASTPDLEFFYDCSSPWTYFAFTRMVPLAEALEVPVRWRPILVGGVFNGSLDLEDLFIAHIGAMDAINRSTSSGKTCSPIPRTSANSIIT